jgi:hypothetical protein
MFGTSRLLRKAMDDVFSVNAIHAFQNSIAKNDMTKRRLPYGLKNALQQHGRRLDAHDYSRHQAIR